MRALMIFCCAVSVAEAAAAPMTVVDQEFSAWGFVAYSMDYAGDYMAQTFTTNHSGTLASIGVRVGLSGYSDYKPPVDNLLVRLVQTDEMGAPDVDRSLASRSYEWQEIPKFSSSQVRYVDFDVTEWNIQVAAGDVLAIVLSSNQVAFDDAGNRLPHDHYIYNWHTTLTDVHPGGDFYLYSPNLFGPEVHKWESRWTNPDNPPFPNPYRDMGFRVLVFVPEADPWILFGIALLPLVAIRLRIGGHYRVADAKFLARS